MHISALAWVAVFLGGAEYAGWDGDNMFGCVCEEGYAGPSCQRIECPRGVDTRAYFREELQQLACECQACAGGVRFSYGGQVCVLLLLLLLL